MTNDNKSYLYLNQTTSTAETNRSCRRYWTMAISSLPRFNPNILLHKLPRHGSNFSNNYAMDITTGGASFGFIRYATNGFQRYMTLRTAGNYYNSCGKIQLSCVKQVDFPTDSIWVKLVFAPWSLYSTKRTLFMDIHDTNQTKLAVAELVMTH